MDHDGGQTAYAPCSVLATWPKGSFVENIAVNPAGELFVTLHTDRAVVRVDPQTGATTPFATFETPVAGLVFGADAQLYVSGGQPGQAPGVIWRVDVGGSVSKAADLPDALFLNGMTLHPDGRLLVIESIGGKVYAVDPTSGAVSVWLSDPILTAVAGDFTPGANGIKFFEGYAYISVTRSDRIVRVPIGTNGAAGAIETVAERLRADDFAVGADGSLFIATHPARSLLRLALNGTRTTLAGPDQGMTGATAVAFGRTGHDQHSVYVTTTGGTMTLPDDQLEMAKLVRVDIGVAGAKH